MELRKTLDWGKPTRSKMVIISTWVAKSAAKTNRHTEVFTERKLIALLKQEVAIKIASPWLKYAVKDHRKIRSRMHARSRSQMCTINHSQKDLFKKTLFGGKIDACIETSLQQ